MTIVENESVQNTEVHKKLKQLIDNVVPLSESLTDDFIREVGVDMAESCRDYYRFYTDLLRDMYENPGEHRLNAGMYESILHGRKYYGVRRSEGDAAVKKCPTDLQRSFFLFLINIGLHGEADGDSLVMKTSLYQKIVSQSVKNKAKDYLIKKPIERVRLLERAGLRVVDGGEWVRIVNAGYPKMFGALCALAKNTTEGSFAACPLRAINGGLKADYSCATRVMSVDEKAIADEIIEHMKQYKIKPEYGFNGITWSRKGKPLVFVGFKDPAAFKVPVFTVTIAGIHAWNDSTYYLSAIANSSDELQKYFLRHLRYCQACSPKGPCEGNYYYIFGKRKRLCGGVCNFADKGVLKCNLPYIKEMIDIRLILSNDGADNK
jgi:hypothetical protein